ncbi:MAG TPA: 3TM-type holin [Alphaproteobacteria bacterium]
MVAAALIQGLPLIVEALGGALGRINNPIAQAASKALSETSAALITGAITPEAQAEANRHLEKMTELAQKEQSETLTQVNESLRAEVASTDPYVRRMRPTFGYLVALTWSAQMLAVAYIITFKTEDASVVVDAIESLSTIWSVALSVLGLYVYKRSDEKKRSFPTKQASASTVLAPARKPRSFND